MMVISSDIMMDVVSMIFRDADERQGMDELGNLDLIEPEVVLA